MKIIKYDVLNHKINKKIALISDIHYYEKKELKKLLKVYQLLKKNNPDYICIPGDFIDEAEVLDENLFVEWLNKLSNVAPILISLGNHDITNRKNERKINYQLFDKINKLNNVYLLDNDYYETKDIRIFGLTLPYEYYYIHKESTKAIMTFLLNKKLEKDNKYNIMLCHSPLSILKNYDKLEIFKNIDLSLYGHTHGGMTPNILRPILKTRGLVTPIGGLFTKYCYGYLKDKKAIITSGITRISHSNIFHKLGFMYKGEIVIISIKTS